MNAKHLRYAIEIGERMFLRYPVKSDREEFVTLRKNSRETLEPLEPIPPSGFDPFGNDVFDREYKGRKSEREHRWLVCTMDTGAIAGRVCLSAIERGPLQSGRLGYWLGDPFVGKGLMHGGIALALKHAFGTLGLHRVSANIMPSNTRSIKTIESCGLVHEGHSKNYLQINGAWKDHDRYAITVEGYNEMNQLA